MVPFTMAWQLRPTSHNLVVTVKATFDLVQDQPATLAAEQRHPRGDVRYDDNETASLVYASDFAVFKPKADVLLIGHAYPSDNPTLSVVTLQVGTLNQTIAVFGDRTWGTLGAQSAPARFNAIPLRWERAMGGPLSETNPVGRGFKTGVLLPNLERRDALVRSPRDVPAPVCFAPIPPEWKARSSKLGSYGSRWLKERWPFFPEDFDFAFFNAAPPELQVPYLRGDESYLLSGIRPDRKPLAGRLAGIVPRVFAQMSEQAGGAFTEYGTNLDTLSFDTDTCHVVALWRSVLTVRDDEASDIAALFVTSSPLGERLDPDEVHARFVKEAKGAGLYQPARPEIRPAPAPPVAPTQQQRATAPSPWSAPSQQSAPRAATGPAWVTTRAKPIPVVPLVPQPAAVAGRPAAVADRPAVTAEPPAPTVPRGQIVSWVEAGDSLAGRDLTGCDLSHLDLRTADLKGTILAFADLRGAKLGGALLQGAVLAHANAASVIFDGANLANADLEGTQLTQSSFRKVDLTGANLGHADARGATFSDANAAGAVFAKAKLSNAQFDRVKGAKADFGECLLDESTWSAAMLDNARFYGAVGIRCRFDGASMKDARMDEVQLTESSFHGIEAEGSVWEHAALSGSSFHQATIARANFTKARMERCVLSGADGREAFFRKAVLREATALKANLMQANFEGADLQLADLRGANLYQVETWRANLQGAKVDLANVTGSKLAR